MGFLGKLEKYGGLALISVGILIIPLTLGALVLGQISKAGSQASAQVVEYTNKCDVNKSGDVDSADVEAASKFFGKVSTPEAKVADIDGNGYVNSGDLAMISKNDPIKCLVGKVPGAPVVLCTFKPSSVVPGDKLTVVGTSGGPYGQVNIQGAYGGTVYKLGDLPQGGTTIVDIPMAPSGLYVLRVGALGATCKSTMGVDLSLTSVGSPSPTSQPIGPSCTLSVKEVKAGEKVVVKSLNGLSGPVGMQGAFQTPVYSNLGNLPSNGSVTITVPANAQAGLYVVRVGSFGVGCTPELAVNRADIIVPPPPAPQGSGGSSVTTQ